MKKLFLLLLLVFLLVPSCTKEEIDTYNNPTTIVYYSNIETQTLVLVNEYRKSINLSELILLDEISNVAKGHTEYMIEAGVSSHDYFGQRVQTLMEHVDAKSVGENVAYGYATAEGVVNGWLNSPNHRAIIENPNYTHFGISIGTSNVGRNYFTNIFIKI